MHKKVNLSKFLNFDPIKYIVIHEYLGGHMPWHYDEESNGIKNCYVCGLKLPHIKNKLFKPVTLSDLTFYRVSFCSKECYAHVK